MTTRIPLKVGEVVFSAVALLAVLLFAPDKFIASMNVNWLLGLIVVLPSSFFAGLLSSSIYYRGHDLTCVDPFYTRAWWSLISGFFAYPVCLIFRPSVADLAFIAFTFGAGPVLAFHVYHRYRNDKPD